MLKDPLIRKTHIKASVTNNKKYIKTESEMALPRVSTWKGIDNLITFFNFK